MLPTAMLLGKIILRWSMWATDVKPEYHDVILILNHPLLPLSLSNQDTSLILTTRMWQLFANMRGAGYKCSYDGHDEEGDNDPALMELDKIEVTGCEWATLLKEAHSLRVSADIALRVLNNDNAIIGFSGKMQAQSKNIFDGSCRRRSYDIRRQRGGGRRNHCRPCVREEYEEGRCQSRCEGR